MAGVYDQLITRVDAAGLIPQPQVIELNQEIQRTSIAFTLMRQLSMSSAQASMAVIDALPHAYWVNGDTGLKQTTKVSWAGKLLTAEEIAVIVPVPEAVIADVDTDIWGQVRPLIAQEFARKVDLATVFGVNRPASFAPAIVPAAAAAAQNITGPDPIAGINEALGLLEGLDVNVNAIAGRAALRGAIRTALSTLGGAVTFGASGSDLFGYPLTYPGGTIAWPANLLSIMGDWQNAILGVRQDITYKILDQGVISDDAGKVIFNLPQQDSVALRAVARYAFATADWQTVDAAGDIQTAYPFATTTSGP